MLTKILVVYSSALTTLLATVMLASSAAARIQSLDEAGMLFFNDEGSENGGLIFGGHRNAKGDVVDSGGSLSFDRYAGNQVVQLAGVDDSTDHIVGLIVSDTDAERNRRVFVGHDKEGVVRVPWRIWERVPAITTAAPIAVLIAISSCCARHRASVSRMKSAVACATGSPAGSHRSRMGVVAL